jgi:hypothetical protein
MVLVGGGEGARVVAVATADEGGGGGGGGVAAIGKENTARGECTTSCDMGPSVHEVRDVRLQAEQHLQLRLIESDDVVPGAREGAGQTNKT